MGVVTPTILRALNAAYKEGRERGGALCCGTTGVWHLPFCTTARPDTVQRLADWLADRHL